MSGVDQTVAHNVIVAFSTQAPCTNKDRHPRNSVSYHMHLNHAVKTISTFHVYFRNFASHHAVSWHIVIPPAPKAFWWDIAR